MVCTAFYFLKSFKKKHYEPDKYYALAAFFLFALGIFNCLRTNLVYILWAIRILFAFGIFYSLIKGRFFRGFFFKRNKDEEKKIIDSYTNKLKKIPYSELVNYVGKDSFEEIVKGNITHEEYELDAFVDWEEAKSRNNIIISTCISRREILNFRRMHKHFKMTSKGEIIEMP